MKNLKLLNCRFFIPTGERGGGVHVLAAADRSPGDLPEAGRTVAAVAVLRAGLQYTGPAPGWTHRDV